MQTNAFIPKNARHLFIDGPVGKLDCIELSPLNGNEITGIAIVCHPDPKGGGTNTNKIVQTIAKVLNQNGYLCICPNLRGVGQSDGEHDYGRGEIEDLRAIYYHLRANYTQPLVLGGFSLGAAIISQFANIVEHKKLILVGPAVTRIEVMVPRSIDTIVIHGEEDEVVSMEKVQEWSRDKNQPIVWCPNTGHFFHGKLMLLQNLLSNYKL